MQYVVHILVNAGLLFLAGKLVNGFEVRDAKAAVVGALVLSLANWLVRPILDWITLPINLLTLGLFSVVVSALILMVVAAVVRGFAIRGFGAALWGAVAIGLMNMVLGMLFGR